MIQHRISQSDHYAASVSGTHRQVLAQLQGAGEQVRVPMSSAQARHFAALLIGAADEVDSAATVGVIGGLINLGT